MLTIDFRMDVAPDRESQMLEALLTPRKTDNVKQLSEAQIKQRIMRGNNPVDQVILVKDSLKLTDAQVDSMRNLGQRFVYVRDLIAGRSRVFCRAATATMAPKSARCGTQPALPRSPCFSTHAEGDRPFHTGAGRAVAEVPQTAGLLLQIRSIKESDLPWLFRSPLSALP